MFVRAAAAMRGASQLPLRLRVSIPCSSGLLLRCEREAGGEGRGPEVSIPCSSGPLPRWATRPFPLRRRRARLNPLFVRAAAAITPYHPHQHSQYAPKWSQSLVRQGCCCDRAKSNATSFVRAVLSESQSLVRQGWRCDRDLRARGHGRLMVSQSLVRQGWRCDAGYGTTINFTLNVSQSLVRQGWRCDLQWRTRNGRLARYSLNPLFVRAGAAMQHRRPLGEGRVAEVSIPCSSGLALRSASLLHYLLPPARLNPLFVRAGAAIGRFQRGSGMGLAQSQSLVRQGCCCDVNSSRKYWFCIQYVSQSLVRQGCSRDPTSGRRTTGGLGCLSPLFVRAAVAITSSANAVGAGSAASLNPLFVRAAVAIGPYPVSGLRVSRLNPLFVRAAVAIRR